MFHLFLDRIEDRETLKDIYDQLRRESLIDKVYVTVSPGKNVSILESFIKCHFLYVRGFDLVHGLSEGEREDYALDIAEKGVTALIDWKGVSMADRFSVLELLKSFECSVHELGVYGNLSLGQPSLDVMGVIKEIIEPDKNDLKKYSFWDFMIEIKINHLDEVYINGKLVGVRGKNSIVNMLFASGVDLSEKIEKIREGEKMIKSQGLDSVMYSPARFLDPSFTFEDMLYEKWSIFEMIKNIEPVSYPDIHPEVVDILRRNDYVMLSDVYRIVEGRDWLLQQEGLREIVKRKQRNNEN